MVTHVLYAVSTMCIDKDNKEFRQIFYLVEFNTFHVAATELAISAFHLFAVFSTELDRKEKEYRVRKKNHYLILYSKM